jgi:Flp pilus assembly protein TadD
MKVVEEAMTAEDFMKQAAARADDGDYVGAIQSYDAVVSLNPENARAYGNRGFIKLNLGDRMGALADFRTAAELFLTQGRMANYEMLLEYIEKIQ